jgi:hypothetical protein
MAEPTKPTTDDKIAALADAVTSLARRVDTLARQHDDDRRRDRRRDAKGDDGFDPSEVATPNEENLDADDDDARRRRRDARQRRGDKDLEEWAEEEVQEPQHRTDAAPTYDPTRPEPMAADDGRLHRRADSTPRMSDEDRRGEIQYDLDQCFQAIRGERAPQPLHAESSRHYLLRGLRALQRFSDDYKQIDLKRLPDDMLTVAARQIRADVQRVARDPALMSAAMGEIPRLREIKTPDATGRLISKFYGPISETLDPFSMPAFRVKRFNTNPDHWR